MIAIPSTSRIISCCAAGRLKPPPRDLANHIQLGALSSCLQLVPGSISSGFCEPELVRRQPAPKHFDDEAPDGLLSVWSEDPDAGFEARLARAGFDLERDRPGRGGRRHAVYLARGRASGGGAR